jgi:methylglutaconyl-CoA hydratase
MAQENKEPYVKVWREHGLATIEFFHPLSNSLPAAILEELAHEIHAEGLNPQTKVILLRSGGDKAFCAGASFDEIAALTTEEEGLKFFSSFAHVINAMRKAPKFIIARVHGKCIGGGVGIAAAADYAIATESAEVKLSELTIGIAPFVVGPAIERKMGLSAFSQLAIDGGKWRVADWARRKGLFAEVHETVEGMDGSIDSLVTSLLHSSMDAMRELKKNLWHGTENWDQLLKERAAISGRLILTDYAKEQIRKFKTRNTEAKAAQ